jgi:hypothetical protein
MSFLGSYPFLLIKFSQKGCARIKKSTGAARFNLCLRVVQGQIHLCVGTGSQLSLMLLQWPWVA